ncbi:MAG: Kelch repeat-containing protein [Nitrospiria bacterium]
MKRLFLLNPVLIAFIVFIAVPSFGLENMRWEKVAPSLQSRTEVAVAALDGKIYLMGGFTFLSVTRRVGVYDPLSDRWNEISKLPVPLHHAGAGVVNGMIYVVGGFEGFSWTPSNKVFAYDVKKDRWLKKQNMPTARGALGVGVWEEKLYAIGGFGENADGKVNVDANEVYDPLADRWEKKAPIPKARDHLAIAELNGKIHAIGGRLGGAYSQNLARHDIYDPRSDQWLPAAPLPKPRSGIAAAVLKGHIYVFGGEAPAGTFHDNDAYNPSTDQWEAALPMPTARHGLGAATVGEKIYVIAGGTKPGGSRSQVNEVFQLD